jgi:GDP-L-fucose synthase
MAVASVHVMQLPKALYDQLTRHMQSYINVGSDSDATIAEVAQAIAQTVVYYGSVEFDTAKPSGVPQKWIDRSRLNALAWQAKVDLEQGLALAY